MKWLLFLFLIFPCRQPLTEDLPLKYVTREPAKGTGPLIILLHGYGGDENHLFGFAKELPEDMRVISVRAPLMLRENSYAWFRLDLSSGVPVYRFAEVEESARLLLKFIDEAKQKYGTDEIYLMGFSQGAIMSLHLGLTNPDKVKGIIALSGRVLNETTGMISTDKKVHDLNVFIGHGKADNVLPLYNGKVASTLCRKRDIPVTYHEYAMGHMISSAEFSDILNWLKKVRK